MANELARYRITESAQVGIEHYTASKEHPADIEVDPNTEPSGKWMALNAPAKAAIKKLKEYRKLPQEQKLAQAEERAEAERERLAAQVNKEMDARPPETEEHRSDGPLGVSPKGGTGKKASVI
jgi:hypothetical protein